MKISDLHKYTTPLSRAMLQTLVNGEKKAEAKSEFLSETFAGTEIEADERFAYVQAITEANRTSISIKAVCDFGYLALPQGDPEFPKEERLEIYRELAEYMSLVRAGLKSFVETHPVNFIEEATSDET